MTAALKPRSPAPAKPVHSTPAEGHHGRTAWLLAGAGALAVVAASLWLIWPQLSRPFVYDDVSFALGAQAVAETGRPFGNQGYLLHLYWEREQWALWHPPLYVYLLGLTVWLFGDGESAARSLGVASLLTCAALAFDLARRAVREYGGTPNQALVASVLAVALLVLNPLSIQATMILDIDNTVLMALITAFVWAVVRLPDRWGTRIIVGLALLFALCLWAKLTTPLALGLAVVFVRLFQGQGWGRGWPGALGAAATCALGAAVFLATWLLISRALGLPTDYTIDVVKNEALESSASSRDRLVSMEAFISGVAPALLWIGPFFCLLFVAAGLPRLWSLLRSHGLRPSDLLVVLGAAIYLAYVFKLAGNLPKYHATMLPLWCAACAALVARMAGRPSAVQWAVAAIGGGVLLWWLLPRMPLYWGIQFEPDLNQQLIAMPLATAVGIAVAWALAGRRALWRGLPLALLIATLAWNVSLDLAQRDRIGSTTYYYGRYGQQAAAEALNTILRPDETFVASKEVAWYAQNRHYIDQESWQYVVWEVQHGEFDGTYLGHDIRVLALEVGEQTFRRAYDGLLLSKGYSYAGEYGNFLIYVRQ